MAERLCHGIFRPGIEIAGDSSGSWHVATEYCLEINEIKNARKIEIKKKKKENRNNKEENRGAVRIFGCAGPSSFWGYRILISPCPGQEKYGPETSERSSTG
ncbi:MAG: hypothetical protein HFH91_11925 [Lachnospiraceae bacterium]|nr:hypothetical protein [Lachnospiraceae bacterium]